MAGRAVGGAGAAGCGAFTLVGLLVGVGLTVYLGSRVMSGVGGDGPGTGGGDLISQASAVANPTVDGLPSTEAVLVLGSSGAIRDGQTVDLSGTRFEPGAVDVTTCLTHVARTADGTTACDATTTQAVGIDGRGAFAVSYPVQRVITVGTTRYDCAASPSACSLVAHPRGTFATGPSAGLAFAADLPPVAAEAPPSS